MARPRLLLREGDKLVPIIDSKVLLGCVGGTSAGGGGDETGGGNGDVPAPNVDDLRARISKMVSKPKCANFIKVLINGTSTEANPAKFTDALIGFDMIRGQGNFIYGDSIHRPMGKLAERLMDRSAEVMHR